MLNRPRRFVSLSTSVGPLVSGFPRLSCPHLPPLILWLLPGPSRWLSTRLIIYLSTATLKHNYRPNRWNQNGHAVPVIAAANHYTHCSIFNLPYVFSHSFSLSSLFILFSVSFFLSSLFISISYFRLTCISCTSIFVYIYICVQSKQRFNANINSRIAFDRIILAKRIDRFTRSSELKFLTYIFISVREVCVIIR